MADPLTTLYRPVGRKELELIRASGFRSFPPCLPSQPFFLSGAQRRVRRSDRAGLEHEGRSIGLRRICVEVRSSIGIPRAIRAPCGWPSRTSRVLDSRGRVGSDELEYRGIDRDNTGVSARDLKLRSPKSSRKLCGGDSADQVVLFLYAFSADGEGVEDAVGEREFEPFILTVAECALP